MKLKSSLLTSNTRMSYSIFSSFFFLQFEISIHLKSFRTLSAKSFFQIPSLANSRFLTRVQVSIYRGQCEYTIIRGEIINDFKRYNSTVNIVIAIDTYR